MGKRRAEALARLGVMTLEDLLYLFPRRYEDRRAVTSLGQLRVNQMACAVARVVALTVPSEPPLGRGGGIKASALLDDGTDTVRAVWFSPYAGTALREGDTLALFGRVELFNGRLQLNNPEFELLTGQPPELIGRIVPVYPATPPLTQRVIKGLVSRAMERDEGFPPDFLPARVRERYGMKSLRDALSTMHRPKDADSWIRARNRLAFDELFLLQAGLLLAREAGADAPALPLEPGEGFSRFLQSLPFRMTGAQERAVQEVLRDMKGTAAMNRLLQGDVGSGKTLVATLALLAASDSGVQAAFLAPTEILAQQHAMRLREALAPLGVPVGFLTGGLRAGERREVLEALQSGAVPIVVGTHAVFAERTAFANLGLVVVDEQHRFGVLQKRALIAKGPSPHVLVMTATPIPRTLVLSVYGDLEVSVLDEMPPGRRPVKTLCLEADEREALLGLIREQARQGRQAYWVCPLIEEAEAKPDLSTVTNRFEELSGLLPEVPVGLLHGRLPLKERAEVMCRFEEGAIGLLVTTTVIEVGMDVPNASLMVIEDAGQFGMAQLHQLRGRVGRGEAESACVLLAGKATSLAGRQRIEALLRTTDGFALAEADLRQRGPGEVCGVRQHGVTDFRVADLVRDRKLLELARNEAQALLREDPRLESEPLLRGELAKRLGKALRLAGIA